MLIVASVIGAGIFFTPGRVAALLPDGRWILLAWVVGGVLSLAGAQANAELGAMFPRAGGDYVYLREGLHPAAGFLVGWLSFFAIYAGTIAALAVILGESLARACGFGETGKLAFAAGIILACSVLNVRGVRVGALANNLTSAMKIVALLAFVVLGLSLGEGDFTPWFSSAPSRAVSGSGASFSWALFGAALSPILFTYLGWNASVFVASEIRDPQRNVPRSLFFGLALCAGMYLLLNAVFLYALAPDEMIGVEDAGEAAARALFGARGGAWISAFVLVSVLGTLNAMVLVGPRIAYAMALDGLFFESVDRVHDRYRTPSVAIWVQAGVSIGLVAFLETFPKALDFTVFAIVIATSADVVALFALRHRQPGRSRPYRTWGYPWVPAAYVVAHIAIGASLVVESPRECLVTGVLLAIGLPIYFLFARNRRQP
jgi:APA family basic amino acid/polyamine antiporter